MDPEKICPKCLADEIVRADLDECLKCILRQREQFRNHLLYIATMAENNTLDRGNTQRIIAGAVGPD